MSAAAPLARTGFKFVLTVRDGPDAGAKFQLLPPRVTIGRGLDCNVVLSDPRVSRMAATIEFSMEEIVVKEASSRQAMSVNGEACTIASIKDGDLIRIGDTDMLFSVKALQLPPPQALSGAAGRGLGNVAGASPNRAPRAASGGMSSRAKFYLGVGVVGLAFAALLMSETPKPKTETGPRSTDEIQKEIEASEKKQEEIIQKRIFKSDAEKTRFEEAQRHFNEGFRDYQKGQWGRAMRSFETARTIDPLHQMAVRYYKLAEKERDQMISDLTLEGRRYREKSMWSRCSAQFEKVLDMIPNKDDVKYKAAEAMKKECDLQAESRFQ